MHPQIQLPEFGLCPICNMDLIPLEEDSASGSPRSFAASEEATKLMDIEVAPVERRSVTTSIRMVGKIDYDETRLTTITAWIPGRLDRLFVDYTGIPVRQGDHLVSLYSPQLLTAQQELIQARQAVLDTQDSDLEVIQESSLATLKAVRDKLRLWGLTAEQIAEIEISGQVSDHMTIYAPTGGIVIHKNAKEGMYVKEGDPIYQIADLSQVWIKLDAYESDLAWLRYGQEVRFDTIAYPGETFTGTIAYIDPILNDQTRTAKVRVNFANDRGMLKPGMLVKAQVQASVAGAGKVMAPGLAHKWICPMHPDIIKDRAGHCDICEMPLVTTESLGYVTLDDLEPPLVIPASAALVTGKRAVVYVRNTEADKPTFEGREIVLGPRAGDFYLVHSGLDEGEIVVTQGNFKIDSALQIQAKPSMMSITNQQANVPPPGDMPIDPELLQQLAQIYQAYFSMQQALASDQPHKSMMAASQLQKAVQVVEVDRFVEDRKDLWKTARQSLQSPLTQAMASHDLKVLREQFYLISQQLIQLSQALGAQGADTVYIMHCPMAFDNQGADWLQDNDDLKNPYFGAMMLQCGTIEEEIKATSAASEIKTLTPGD